MPIRFYPFLLCWCCISCSQPSNPLTSPDLASINPDFFADDELDLPYYLAHFHRVANSVILEGENRGFIELPVWRRERDNLPHNARIMENILSLAFFYANDRPWNIYYASAELRYRLEAALAFWCKIQSPQGAFSEYGPEQWNLAATAFATKFMGESLHWLENGPPIDEQLLKKVIESDRKAIHFVLTDSSFYAHGINYSNQYSNVWAGALAYLDLHPEEEIQTLLIKRLQQSISDFQSTAGYFYEANGPDWGYNLGTHHSNLHMAFHYANDPVIRDILSQKDRAFSDWLSFNCAPEPQADEYILNRGIECRQQLPALKRYGWFLTQGMPLTQVDPLSHAFTFDQEEVKNTIEQTRKQLTLTWPQIAALPVGDFNAFSPYAFLYRRHDRYYPTTSQRLAAIEQLPVNQPPFVHQRYDARNKTVYTFIRRSTYYAVFNNGSKVRDQQRFGLGLIWSPSFGACLQSQTHTIAAAWGTRFHPDSSAVESKDLNAQFFMDNQPVALSAGNRNLPGKDFNIVYNLNEKGKKEIRFLSDRIQVSVSYPGQFHEFLPLLIPEDDLPIPENGKITLTGMDKNIQILYSGSSLPVIKATDQLVGHKKVFLLQFTAQNKFTYEIQL